VRALDTNVLVRFLVEDDPVQSAKAGRVIERAMARNEALFISDLVLCETVWVLLSAYRVPRREVADVLSRVLMASHLAFRDAEALLRAHRAFVGGRGDFADYVLREHALTAGCDEVVTFDRALLKEKGFAAP
jgi:predicted nucleic-acid-binding protein